MEGSQIPFVLRPTLQLSSVPAVPVSAVINTGAGTLTVAFSKPLQNGLVNPAPFDVRFNSFEWIVQGTSSVIDGILILDIVQGAPFIPINELNYSATPATLIDTDGFAVAAFIDFPVTGS